MARLAIPIAAAVALLSAGSAFPQAIQNVVLRNSFNPTGAGARGQGMGGAFIAVADDGTAASFNPAGLAQLRRTELAVVGFHSRLTSDLTIPSQGTTQTSSSSNTHGALDFAGLAVPFEVGGRNLTVQLSYQRTVDLFGRGAVVVQNFVRFEDLGIDLPGFVDVIADVQPEQSGAFHTATFSTAYELSDRMSLGFSLNYWFADWTAQGTSNFRLLALTGVERNPFVEFYRIESDFLQEQSARGLNMNWGLLLRYPKISVGAVLNMPFTLDYDLHEVSQQTYHDLGSQPYDEEFFIDLRTGLHWPRTAGFGIALRPFTGLTVAADYTRSWWSRMYIENVADGALLTTDETDADGDDIDVYTDRNFFDLLPASETDTTDTDSWRVGVEYLLSLPKVVIPFRGGLFRDRSPVTELSSGEGREIEGWTLGAGLNFSRVALDVAFERRESFGLVGLRLRRGEVVETSNAATENVTEDRIVASLIYRFGGDDDPLKGLFRSLFGSSDE